MPNCFQLYRLGSQEPASLTREVDAAICTYLEVQMDEVAWCYGWYDYIGFMLAIGKSYVDIAEALQKEIAEGSEWARIALRINHFLCENYRSDAWWEGK